MSSNDPFLMIYGNEPSKPARAARAVQVGGTWIDGKLVGARSYTAEELKQIPRDQRMERIEKMLETIISHLKIVP